MIFSKKAYAIFIAFMTLLIVLSFNYIDEPVAQYFIKNAQTFEEFGLKASTLGESHWYIGAGILGALFFAFVKKNSLYMHRFLFLLYANLFSGVLSIVLKVFFGRIRPWEYAKDPTQYGFLFFQNPDYSLMQNLSYQASHLLERYAAYASFPSGHTTTTMAVFTYLTLLFPKYVALWLPLALFSMSSRVLANDHFVSDVFAGIIVGGIATLFIYSKMKHKLYTEKKI